MNEIQSKPTVSIVDDRLTLDGLRLVYQRNVEEEA